MLVTKNTAGIIRQQLICKFSTKKASSPKGRERKERQILSSALLYFRLAIANNAVGQIHSLPKGDTASCTMLKPHKHLKLNYCLGIGTLQKALVSKYLGQRIVQSFILGANGKCQSPFSHG